MLEIICFLSPLYPRFSLLQPNYKSTRVSFFFLTRGVPYYAKDKLALNANVYVYKVSFLVIRPTTTKNEARGSGREENLDYTSLNNSRSYHSFFPIFIAYIYLCRLRVETFFSTRASQYIQKKCLKVALGAKARVYGRVLCFILLLLYPRFLFLYRVGLELAKVLLRELQPDLMRLAGGLKNMLRFTWHGDKTKNAPLFSMRYNIMWLIHSEMEKKNKCKV